MPLSILPPIGTFNRSSHPTPGDDASTCVRFSSRRQAETSRMECFHDPKRLSARLNLVRSCESAFEPAELTIINFSFPALSATNEIRHRCLGASKLCQVSSRQSNNVSKFFSSMIVKLQWPSSMAFLRAFLDYILRRRQAKPNSRSSKALAVGSRRATSSSQRLTPEPLLVYLKKRFVDIILNRSLRALPDLRDADSCLNESSNLCKPSSNLPCSKYMDQKSKAPTYFRDVGNIGNEMHPTRSEGYCTLCKGTKDTSEIY